MTYKIYQLTREHTDLLFRGYNPNTFNISNYNEIYSGEIETTGYTINDLDNIYLKFNGVHPEDFHGHSLSISDVVELDGTLYYVERMGWKKL